MEVQISNLPPTTTTKELKNFLQPILLERFDNPQVDFTDASKHGVALVTFPYESTALCFLRMYGGMPKDRPAQETLAFNGKELVLKAGPRRSQPESLLVETLRKKERKVCTTEGRETAPPYKHAELPFDYLSTGIWEYDRLDKLVFDRKFKDSRKGTISFNKRALVLFVSPKSNERSLGYRIEIPYASIKNVMGSYGDPRIAYSSITVGYPPSIYRVNLDGRISARLCRLSQDHSMASALCPVYRLSFLDQERFHEFWELLEGNLAIPGKGYCWSDSPSAKVSKVEDDFAVFHKRLAKYSQSGVLNFYSQFQILSTVLDCTISPLKMASLLPKIDSEAGNYLANNDIIPKPELRDIIARAIRRLLCGLSPPGPHIDGGELRDKNITQQFAAHLLAVHNLRQGQHKHKHLPMTLRAIVTPTGLFLRGLETGVSNVVLHKYSAYSENFMRVSVAEEDGTLVQFRESEDGAEVYLRFGKLMKNGIQVLDRTFEYLGASQSSLRDHTLWFVAPFKPLNSKMVRAQDIIKGQGDFSHIHCAAKCTARIGQAFSDCITTIDLEKLNPLISVDKSMPDVERNGRIFSDGCGTISLSLLEQVWTKLPNGYQRQKPTVLQIRYKGAKGVVSLDPRLEGYQLRLRQSMVKFDAGADLGVLGVCGASHKRLPVYLNHQSIKLLEDKEIPNATFLELQGEATGKLDQVFKDSINAANFLATTGCSVHARLPTFLGLLDDIGLSYLLDPFLTTVVGIAALNHGRELKYRARIPVEEGMTLYGIMDEFNVLKEGEVYISTQTYAQGEDHPSSIVVVKGCIIVTRSPSLHPGDIQTVKAVDVDKDSPLKALYNCIVFSQQGARDLPSKLGGGDLDGDMFHIIHDKRLVPGRKNDEAAEYAPAPAKDLGRPASRDDMIESNLVYMKSCSILGVVTNRHKIIADKAPQGTAHKQCIRLAEEASLANDFIKSGNQITVANSPFYRKKRWETFSHHDKPDFMSPLPGIIYNNQSVGLDEPPTQSGYYPSKKILGILYRSMDQKDISTQMKKAHATPPWDQNILMGVLTKYVDEETCGVKWDHHRAFAKGIRLYYEETMFDLTQWLRPHRSEPLHEIEVFTGTILRKKDKKATQKAREADREVRDCYNRHVSALITRIIQGDDVPSRMGEALPRAIACFKIAMEDMGMADGRPAVESFRIVAATVCLQRLEVYMRERGLPLRSLAEEIRQQEPERKEHWKRERQRQGLPWQEIEEKEDERPEMSNNIVLPPKTTSAPGSTNKGSKTDPTASLSTSQSKNAQPKPLERSKKPTSAPESKAKGIKTDPTAVPGLLKTQPKNSNKGRKKGYTAAPGPLNTQPKKFNKGRKTDPTLNAQPRTSKRPTSVLSSIDKETRKETVLVPILRNPNATQPIQTTQKTEAR